jgi:hypothetical protein
LEIPRQPKVWIGYLFAAGFIVAEFVEPATGDTPFALGPLTLGSAVAGWIFWLYCVYRFHSVLQAVTRSDSFSGPLYSISPGQSVAFHFIPFFNFVWIVRWPWLMIKFIHEHSSVRPLPGGLVGGLCLAALLLRFFDGGIGLAALLGVGQYLSAKLAQAVGEIRSSRQVAEVFA